MHGRSTDDDVHVGPGRPIIVGLTRCSLSVVRAIDTPVMREISLAIVKGALSGFNRLHCRFILHIRVPSSSPLPERGPVILVCDHTSVNDGMILMATAGRPICFFIARERYRHPLLHWVYRLFEFIPVSRGTQDVGAVRTSLRALHAGKVVGIFPQGGIDEHRNEEGHSGVGYLAVKSGAPVVPSTIIWDKPRPMNLLHALLVPGKAVIRYGPAMTMSSPSRPTDEAIHTATNAIMRAIRELRASH